MASEQKNKKKKVQKKATRKSRIPTVKKDGGEKVLNSKHTVEQLTDIKQSFIRWMAMSDTQRCIALEVEPVDDAKGNKRYPKPTLKMFTDYHGIGERTVYNWKSEKGFDGAVTKELKAWGDMNVANVLMALYNNAITKGGAQEVELYLAYFKDWTKKTQIVHKEELTENDIRNAIAMLPAEKQDKFFALLDEIVAATTTAT